MKRRNNGRAMSMPAGIAIGIICGAVITAVGAAFLSWLVVSERMDMSGVGYGCMAILTCASLVGSLLSVRLVRHRRGMVTVIVCVGYYALLLILGAVFGGVGQGMGVTAVMILLGGVIGSIPSLIMGRSGARRHKIPTYR